MLGKPEDVPGECNAWLLLGDDYGDNSTTCRCKLPEGHEGAHQEKFMRNDKPVTIQWWVDESVICPVCKARIAYLSRCDQCGREICYDCLDMYPGSLMDLCQKCYAQKEKEAIKVNGKPMNKEDWK